MRESKEQCRGNTAVRHQRRTTSTPAVGAERCRPPGHRHPSVWPHHTSVMAAALAASPSAHCVQDRLLDWLPRTSQTSVAFCRTLVVAHCGPIPMTFGSYLFHEHITNSVIGVSQPPVLDCGKTFHLDSGGRDLPSTLSGNLWKLIYWATEALSDSFECISAI